MKSLVRLGTLLLCGCAASVSLAQVQTTPTPLAVTPLIGGLNATLCANGCDNAAMSCQNSCLTAVPVVPPTPAVGSLLTPLPTINPSCPLNCTSQQIVCKQACPRTP
jgi:hypothetical protein